MKHRIQLRFIVRNIPALMAAALASGAFAQATSSTTLEEVIVTAQKQKEKLQNVPISIQAFNTKTLETAGVTNVNDVRALVPSVEFKTYPFSSESLQIQMRGSPSSTESLLLDAPVAIHIDGVYIARFTGLNLTVADLESIEILKGPQGTLYGRNAMAGAVNLNTARPSQDFGFTQGFTAGNYGKLVSKTTINVPVTDQLAFKLAYVHDQSDGFIKDSNGGGNNWGDRKADAGRFDVRWKPTDKVTVDYGYDWSDTKYINTPDQCINQVSTRVGGALASAASYPASLCSTSYLDSLPMPNNANFSMGDPWNKVKSSGHNIKVEWKIDDATTLRSVTGYRSLRDQRQWNSVAGDTTMLSDANLNFPGNVYTPNFYSTGVRGGVTQISAAGFVRPANIHYLKDDYFSQEFVLLGKLNESLRYTTGLYYFREKGSTTSTGNLPSFMNLAPRFSGLPAESISIAGSDFSEANNKSVAFFGQMTWTPNILDRKLDITPGIRFTRDTRIAALYAGGSTTYYIGQSPAGLPNALLTAFGLGTLLAPGTNVPQGVLALATGAPTVGFAGGIPVNGANTFTNTSPALTVQYHLSDALMTYGKIVRGYRSGGFTPTPISNANFARGFAPETLTTVEGGFKGEFLDRRLRANLAIYQSKYKDQIVTVASQVFLTKTDLINAGKSTFNGLELDLNAAVTDKLKLGFNYSYVDFKYDKVTDPTTGADITQFYHIIPSKNNYGANLDYAFGKVGPARMNWHLDYYHVDTATSSTVDTYAIAGGVAKGVSLFKPGAKTTPAYGVWNTRLAFDGIAAGPGNHGDISVGLWVKNLADKKYMNYVIDYAATTLMGNASTWGAPRTYGIDVTYRY